MKLKFEDLELLSAERWVTDFDSFNGIQNRYNLKCASRNIRFPKHLIICALRRFNEICDSYYIDASKYKYFSVGGGGSEITWSVTFYTGKDETNDPKVQIYEIYYDSKGKRILQSCYAMN